VTRDHAPRRPPRRGGRSRARARRVELRDLSRRRGHPHLGKGADRLLTGRQAPTADRARATHHARDRQARLPAQLVGLDLERLRERKVTCGERLRRLARQVGGLGQQFCGARFWRRSRPLCSQTVPGSNCIFQTVPDLRGRASEGAAATSPARHRATRTRRRTGMRDPHALCPSLSPWTWLRVMRSPSGGPEQTGPTLSRSPRRQKSRQKIGQNRSRASERRTGAWSGGHKAPVNAHICRETERAREDSNL
jgi:hypothetical protein